MTPTRSHKVRSRMVLWHSIFPFLVLGCSSCIIICPSSEPAVLAQGFSILPKDEANPEVGRKSTFLVLWQSIPKHLSERYFMGQSTSFPLKPWCPWESEGNWQWKEQGFLVLLTWVWILVIHLPSLCLIQLLNFTEPHFSLLSNGHNNIWRVYLLIE